MRANIALLATILASLVTPASAAEPDRVVFEGTFEQYFDWGLPLVEPPTCGFDVWLVEENHAHATLIATPDGDRLVFGVQGAVLMEGNGQRAADRYAWTNVCDPELSCEFDRSSQGRYFGLTDIGEGLVLTAIGRFVVEGGELRSATLNTDFESSAFLCLDDLASCRFPHDIVSDPACLEDPGCRMAVHFNYNWSRAYCSILAD